MVMELLAGRSLLDAMLDDGPFSSATLVIARQLTRALRKAHHEGVVIAISAGNVIVDLDAEGLDFIKSSNFRAGEVSRPQGDRGLGAVRRRSSDACGLHGRNARVRVTGASAGLRASTAARTSIRSASSSFQMITGKLPSRDRADGDRQPAFHPAKCRGFATRRPDIDCSPDSDASIRKSCPSWRSNRYGSMDQLLAELKTLCG